MHQFDVLDSPSLSLESNLLFLPAFVDAVGQVAQPITIDVEPEVRLSSYCLDPRIAVVFSLEYDVGEAEGPYTGGGGESVPHTSSAPVGPTGAGMS